MFVLKGLVEQPFDKEISMDVNHEFNQPLQQKLGIEMELYQQKLPVLNGREWGWDRMKEGCQA